MDTIIGDPGRTLTDALHGALTAIFSPSEIISYDILAIPSGIGSKTLPRYHSSKDGTRGQEYEIRLFETASPVSQIQEEMVF